MITLSSCARITASLLVPLLWFTPGCAKSENKPAAAQENPTPKTESVPIQKSAQKNSFNEVARHLDLGGEFLLYWSAEKILSDLSTKASDLRSFVTTLPNIPEDDRGNIEKGFDIATRLIKQSGVEEISGIGMSSIAQEGGLYHSKIIVHHYKGKDTGFGWSLFGKKPHPLTALAWLPATTVMAGVGDLDLGQLWLAVSNQVAQADFPQAQALLGAFPNEFEKATHLKFDQLLGSLGGEFGIVVTMDDSKKISLPTPTQAMQFPEPGLLIMVKVKDDAIFNRVDKLLEENPAMGQQVIRVDKDGLKMRTMPIPLPLPILLRPTVARAGDYLIVATTDALVEDAFAASKKQKPGWKSSEEFAKLSRGAPVEGNQVFFVSEQFSKIVGQIQKQALQMNPRFQPDQLKALEKFFGSNSTAYSYSVGANTDEGWLLTGNGNTASSQFLVGAVIAAPVGLIAAIAIPNFVKARQSAQRNAILANLRMIQGAKEQWALENKKKDGDTVAETDIGPYLRDGRTRSIQGESYKLNPVGTSPTAKMLDGSEVTIP